MLLGCEICFGSGSLLVVVVGLAWNWYSGWACFVGFAGVVHVFCFGLLRLLFFWWYVTRQILAYLHQLFMWVPCPKAFLISTSQPCEYFPEYSCTLLTYHSSFLWPHELPDIPNTKPLIPPRASRPPFTPKQAPIHSAHEFRVSAHPSQLFALLTTKPLQPRARRLCFRTPIRPHSTRHVIARAEQGIRQMRTPRHPPNRIIVSRKHNQRALPRRPDIKRPDQPIHPGRRDDRRAIFIPVVRQGFVGREWPCWALGVG